MAMIADILLVGGALGAGLYCLVLSRRLTKFNDLEKGVGGAVAVLSAQVDDLTKTLQSAQKTASLSTRTLGELTERADLVAQRLELLCASMHDIPEAQEIVAGDAALQEKAATDPEPEPQAEPEEQQEHETVVVAEEEEDVEPAPVFSARERASAGGEAVFSSSRGHLEEVA